MSYKFKKTPIHTHSTWLEWKEPGEHVLRFKGTEEAPDKFNPGATRTVATWENPETGKELKSGCPGVLGEAVLDMEQGHVYLVKYEGTTETKRGYKAKLFSVFPTDEDGEKAPKLNVAEEFQPDETPSPDLDGDADAEPSPWSA